MTSDHSGSAAPATNPWRRVLQLIERFEDAYALMALHQEATDGDLLANGVSVDELTAPVLASTRAVAEVLAQRFREIDADQSWTYSVFCPWSSGVAATAAEVQAFVSRCREQGIVLEVSTSGRR